MLGGLLAPPPRRNANRWAAAHRVLPPGTPRPGPWDPDFAPYIDPIADAFLDPRLRMVVVMMGTQMGKSELVFNLLGHTAAERPRPALYIGPTETLCRTNAKNRWEPVVAHTPALAEALDVRAERNAVLEKWINGVRIGFGWSGSSTQLRSHAAALVLCDEVDEFEDVPDQGDPVSLAEARVSNYNGTVGLFSSPTDEETSRIWDWFERGTREYWCLECAHCGAWFRPRTDLLRWGKDLEGLELQASARLHCAECNGAFDDRARRALRGRYIAHARDGDGDETPLDAPPARTIASFAVSGLCSPFRSLGRAADELATAFRSGNPAEVQAKVNSVGGEPYGLPGDTPGVAAIKDKRGAYDAPAGVQVVTLGADVQAESIYFSVRGWGYNAESWLLDRGQLFGNTEYDEIWLALARVAARTYCDGRALPIRFGLVDSGYRAAQVYACCRRVANLSPSKGHDTLARPHYDATVDEQPSGRAVKIGLKLWHFDTDYYKRWVYARIRWPHGQPGDWHLPADIEDEYCAQVVNEVRTVVRRKVVWKPTGNRRNHYLDAEVNATVAAHILNVLALPALAPPSAEQSAAPTRPGPARGGAEVRSPFARQGL